jgi:hypothetical protein
MKTDDIKKLAVRDRKGREISNALREDSSIDAYTALVALEGRLNNPRLSPALASAPDMTPARQRRNLEQSLATYESELTDAVVENIDASVRGFEDAGLVKYLISTPLKPGKHGGVSKEWLASYAAARDATALLNDPERELPGRMAKYIESQLESLKKDKVSDGIIAGLVWAYGNNSEIVQKAVLADAAKNIKEFEGKSKEGRSYVAALLKKLKGKEQRTEAYRVGQALAA